MIALTGGALRRSQQWQGLQRCDPRRSKLDVENIGEPRGSRCRRSRACPAPRPRIRLGRPADHRSTSSRLCVQYWPFQLLVMPMLLSMSSTREVTRAERGRVPPGPCKISAETSPGRLGTSHNPGRLRPLFASGAASRARICSLMGVTAPRQGSLWSGSAWHREGAHACQPCCGGRLL